MSDNKDSEKKDMDMDTCKTEKGLEVVNADPPPPAEPFLPCGVEKTDVQPQPLLPPDHPLLQRFQQSLKEHLLRIKNQLTEEIDEIKHNIKLKEEEREDYGVKLYDMQHEIEKQNEVLEEYAENIRDTVTKRIEGEKLRDSLRAEYDEKFELTKQQKFNYNQRLVELSHLQNLENNVRQWTDEFENQLVTSKRTVSKDFQLQKLAAEEKHKADLMSFNLQVEIKKREEELAGIREKIAEQKELNNTMYTSLADANADLEALQTEHKRLTQAWGEVIVAISHRDKVLFQARESLEKQQESLKLTKASIEGTKKQIAKETEQNIKLKAFKANLENDKTNISKEYEKQSKILAKLDQKLEELPVIIDQTDKDLLEAKKESNQLAAKINSLQFKLEKQYNIKVKIEEAIMKIAQDQLMCDKASGYRMKVLHNTQESRRVMEANLRKIEHQVENLLIKLERQKALNKELTDEAAEFNAKLKSLNDEYDDLSNEIKTIANQASLKMKLIEKLSKTLTDLLKEAEGCEVSPTEQKIKNLEKGIQQTELKVSENQQFWLILQGHIIHLSEKRNRQLNDIQLARKQLMIISQKSLKIDTDLEEADNCTQEITREIQHYTTKLELITAQVFEKKLEHESNEFNCNLEHCEILAKLKDNEIRVLEMEQEITDLQEEIEQHKQLVLDHHREALSWETKYKLIDETLRWRRSETAIESEIGNMRAEIHRMQIRYKELKRAQEKLIQDLDHCVMHRERIFVVASTKQKMEGAQFRSRTNVQQRLNDVRTKLKQVHTEITAADKELNELIKETVDIDGETAKIQKDIDEETYQDKLISEQIEQAVLMRHMNLDRIVRQQNRAKEYRRLTATALPRMSKSETAVDFKTQKQSEINHHLNEVIEILLNDFPDKKFILVRLQQALQG